MFVGPFILLKQLFYSKVVALLLLERLPERQLRPRTFHLTAAEAAGPAFGSEAAYCGYFLHWG